jgi:glucose 1-dehydrogenase
VGVAYEIEIYILIATSFTVVLAGKVALVTGASRGIGKAVAVGLARAGADVAINYYAHRDEAEAVAAEVRQIGRRAVLCQADVADFSAVARMTAQTVQELGRLDIAIANAVYSDRALFYEANLKEFHRTIDVSMWGAFNLLRTSAEKMIAQKQGGSIVIVSSPHAFTAVPRAMAYNMSKAAIDQMARTAAIELVDHRIRVNIVHPGWIDTPGERKFADEEQIRQAASKLPWGRMGTPEEISRGVVFLCDPASDYMTGSSLLIDGGGALPWWAKNGVGAPG